MHKQGAEKDSRLWLTPMTISYRPCNLNLHSLKSSKGQVKTNYEKTSLPTEAAYWSSKSFSLFKFIYVDLCPLCPLVDCCKSWSLCMTTTCILGPRLSSMMETLNITKRSSFALTEGQCSPPHLQTASQTSSRKMTDRRLWLLSYRYYLLSPPLVLLGVVKLGI